MEEEEEEEEEGLLRWGVAPLWVKGEEEKEEKGPHGFATGWCKPTGCLDP